MANVTCNSGKAAIIGGNGSFPINLMTDSIYMVLLTSAYTPSVGHTSYSNVSANEVPNGSGYTTGGAALASKNISVETINNRAYFTAANVNWSASTITAAFAALLKRVGGSPSGTDPLIGIYDFGGNKSSSSGNFTLQPDATDGYLYL